MHVDITIKNGGKLFTIKYDRVKFVELKNWDSPRIKIHLFEDYTAESINKYWYEFNSSVTPYVHLYEGNLVTDVHVSEV